MRFESESELVKHIKNDPVLPVYLLNGQQNFLDRL